MGDASRVADGLHAGSIYPAVQNLLLGARSLGLAANPVDLAARTKVRSPYWSPYWSPYGSCFIRLMRLLVGVSELD